MIKKDTLCIIIHDMAGGLARDLCGTHIGHLATTLTDSAPGNLACFVCGFRFFGQTNQVRCCCGKVGYHPTAWLKPLPPLTEEETREVGVTA